MNYLYWIVIFLSIITFGIVSAHNYKRYKGKWYWLFACFYISAIWLSGIVFISAKAVIITGIVVLLGNILFWDIIWNFSHGIRFGMRIRRDKEETKYIEEIYQILEEYWAKNKSNFNVSSDDKKKVEFGQSMAIYLRENYEKVEKEKRHKFLIKNSRKFVDNYFKTKELPNKLGELLFLFSNISETLYVWSYHIPNKKSKSFIEKHVELLGLILNKLVNI